ncbi:MAG: hypothetical protein Ct9H300mP23_03870 [Nitrospinota bacterium]|nr:MAG: hypothetical protein Ct9H300mP23_03870 [Nitrospinota bacterium]
MEKFHMMEKKYNWKIFWVFTAILLCIWKAKLMAGKIYSGNFSAFEPSCNSESGFKRIPIFSDFNFSGPAQISMNINGKPRKF